MDHSYNRRGPKPPQYFRNAMPKNRFALLYYPNGLESDHWYPKTDGADYDMTGLSMEPLKRHRKDFLMLGNLSVPMALFKKNLGHPSETVAYPYGAADDEVAQLTAQNGYRAAFTVRRQSNPSFVSPFRIARSQVYSEMSLKEVSRLRWWPRRKS